ncbi:MAG: hypothetical protein AAGI07_13725, partial [Bacteroidota bacterium]
ENETLAAWMTGLSNAVENTIANYFKEYLNAIYQLQSTFIQSVEALMLKTENQIKNRFKRRSSQGKTKILSIHSQFLKELQTLVYKYQNQELLAIKKQLHLGGQMFQGEISYLLRIFSQNTNINYDLENLKEFRPELLKKFSYIEKVLVKVFNDKLSYQINFAAICKSFIYRNLVFNQNELASKVTADAFRLLALLQKNTNLYFQKINLIESQFNVKTFTFSKAQDEIEKVTQLMAQLQDDLKKDMQGYKDFLITETVRDLQKIAGNLDKLQISNNYYYKKREIKQGKKAYEKWVSFPEIYAHNLNLYTSFFALDISTKLLQNDLRGRMAIFNQSLVEKLQLEASLPLKNVQSKLRKLKTSLEKNDEIQEIQVEVTPPFSENGSFEILLNDLKALTGALPYETEAIEYETLNNPYPNRIEEMPSVNFSPSVVANFQLQTLFIEPLIAEMNTLREEARKSSVLVKDVVRLINFGIDNISNQQEEEKQKNAINELLKLIQEENKRLRFLTTSLKKTSTAFITQVDKQLAEVSDSFNAYTMVKGSTNIGINLRNRSRIKAITRIADIYHQIREQTAESFTQLVYRRSEGLLAAKKLGKLQNKGFLVEEILNLKEKITPSQQAANALPYYYGQLFLNGKISGDEMWYGRNKQLLQVNKAIHRFKLESSGALLIMGMPHSGKTFLANYTANLHFTKEQVFKIAPPHMGSTDLKEFKMALVRKLPLRGNVEGILNRLSPGAVLVFEDMERWWERGPNGYNIIKYLISLIDRFSSQHFFIVVMNPFTYRFINQVVKLEDSFIQVIDCEPFDAKSLRDIILLRHQSSGMKFKLNDVIEDEVSTWRLANLFAAVFDASNGNVGVALQTWISCVQKVEGNILTLSTPKLPAVDILRRLPSAWIIILIQLILHRQLTFEKLDKIMNFTEPQLAHHVAALKRSGLVEEEKALLKINRFMENTLIQVFMEDKIL